MAINKTINKQTGSHGAMRNCIEYLLKEGKTDRDLVYLSGPYSFEELSYDFVYRSFLEEKQIWGKDSGRMYAHNIISWHKDEQITLEQALEFGKEFAENWFSGFQTLVAVHKDREHIHCHFVTNSVSYLDGHKLHNTKKDLEKMQDQEEIQKLSSERSSLQRSAEEMLSINQEMKEENQKLRIELSQLQRTNRSLQKNNDSLRNNKGLLLMAEQEELIRELKNVQSRNYDLKRKVDQSFVAAVEAAKKDRDQAEKRRKEQERYYKYELEKEKRKGKERAHKLHQRIRESESRKNAWAVLWILAIVLSVLTSETVLADLVDFFVIPFRFLFHGIVDLAEWAACPTYKDYGLDGSFVVIEIATGTAWLLRIVTVIGIAGGALIISMLVGKLIIWIKDVWDRKLSIAAFYILTISAATGDWIRKYLPINLLCLNCFVVISVYIISNCKREHE